MISFFIPFQEDRARGYSSMYCNNLSLQGQVLNHESDTALAVVRLDCLTMCHRDE